MNILFNNIQNLRVLVMGLGLHGGGVESALFFLKKGARVTVTDLKDESVLLPSMEKLKNYDVRFVLGRHDEVDFSSHDLVIKNPGVPKTSPYLTIARDHSVPIETDISLFLRLAQNPLMAVTGSKGKSTSASAIHSVLSRVYPGARLGGNITIPPLGFIDSITPDVPVVLELSSWQLADLGEMDVLHPKVSIVTNILPDHLNWYKSMDHYIADKKIICKNQGKDDYSVFNLDCPYVESFAGATPALPFYFSSHKLPENKEGAYLHQGGGYLKIGETRERILDQETALKGMHNKMNLLCAGLALSLFGLDPGIIRRGLGAFTGIEHRCELFLTHNHVRYYNDSAATIPQATVAAVCTLAQSTALAQGQDEIKGEDVSSEPVFLITGGTDKNIDFTPLLEVSSLCEKIYLIEGSGTEKIVTLFNQKGVSYIGPFSSLKDLVAQVLADVYRGVSVLFSPGCASFGLFLNEFDRGRKFKEEVAGQLAISPLSL